MSVDKRESDELMLASLTALAESLPTVPPDPAERARLLDALTGPERFMPWCAEVVRLFGLVPELAAESLRRIPDPTAWRPGLWPGSRVLASEALLSARTWIAELPAGLHLAKHQHGARELTFILDGELRELGEDGVHTHESGALLDRPAGSQHELVVSERTRCLVVFSLSAP